MSAEEVEGAGKPFIGFHTFADDTPRDIPEASPAGSRAMASWTTPPDDWAETDGDQGPGLQLASHTQRARPNRQGLWVALLVVALVGGAAVALGLGLQREERSDRQLALSASAAPMPIRVAPPSQPLAMAAVGTPEPMDVHAFQSPAQPPPAAAPAAPAAAPKATGEPDPLALLAAEFSPPHSQPEPQQAVGPAPTPKIITPPPVLAEAAPPPPPMPEAARPQIVPGPQIAELTPTPPSSRSAPVESCRYARTRAEFMVCGDPELAAEDRQVTQAYRAAIAAGAPQGRLAREQQDWLNAREDASRRSRRAVQNLYALRLDDLAQWLDDDPAGTRR